MEAFRDVVGYEGVYQVSNHGNVKSLKFGKEKLLKLRTDRYGYLRVLLCKNGKHKTHNIHRLVASAFIDNPDNLPQVNHKDEDKTNNCVENLEWCTAEYNNNYGTHNQRMAEAKSIPIDMLTKEGELVRTFPSCIEAERWLRVNGFPKAGNANITKCCKGKLQSCYGHKWQYTKELPN